MDIPLAIADKMARFDKADDRADFFGQKQVIESQQNKAQSWKKKVEQNKTHKCRKGLIV